MKGVIFIEISEIIRSLDFKLTIGLPLHLIRLTRTRNETGLDLLYIVERIIEDISTLEKTGDIFDCDITELSTNCSVLLDARLKTLESVVIRRNAKKYIMTWPSYDDEPTFVRCGRASILKEVM
jgi:hypothetical protein